MPPTCADSGPWPCVEAGCPAPSVSCAVLRQACGALFDEIWEGDLPEQRLRGRAVQDECPAACGVCAERRRQWCELLSREVLVAADTASSTLEVQRLRFALPEGHVAAGPTAHVKVRAPDAPGQRGRVRAYSMLLDERRASFNLTVKIYPGGPPLTRGTSAWLGSLPLGGYAAVPQTRRMEWTVAPETARRVGMVAFGVGIVECLEPLALLLAAGAEVRVVYASRSERQLLYTAELRELLAAHAPRLSVRHCLSRSEGQEDEEEQQQLAVREGACPAGERRTRGRVDAAMLRDEFGSWAAAGSEEGAHFLVVGSGRQERDAWGWLREMQTGGLPVRRLLAGGRWRELVPRTDSG